MNATFELLQAIEHLAKTPYEIWAIEELPAWNVHFIVLVKNLWSDWHTIVLMQCGLCFSLPDYNYEVDTQVVPVMNCIIYHNTYYPPPKISQSTQNTTTSRKGLVQYSPSHGSISIKYICWTNVQRTLSSTRLNLNLQKVVWKEVRRNPKIIM